MVLAKDERGGAVGRGKGMDKTDTERMGIKRERIKKKKNKRKTRGK